MERKGKHFPLQFLGTVHHLNFTTLQHLNVGRVAQSV